MSNTRSTPPWRELPFLKWPLAVKLLDGVFHLLSWIWGTVILGGILVNILIDFVENKPNDQGDPTQWLFVGFLQHNPPLSIAMGTGLILLTGFAVLAHRSPLAHLPQPGALASEDFAVRQALLPRTLPSAPANFVGHEAELKTLCTLVREGKSAAVTGMGGVGKSTLAAAAMQLLAKEDGAFPGGISTIQCNARKGLSGLVWIYDQIRADWNISIPDQVREQMGWKGTDEDDATLRERVLHKWRQSFAEQPPPAILLLLDNVEDELPLSHLLNIFAALNITVVVTARKRFSSDRLHLIPLDVLSLTDAVRLFIELFSAQGGRWNADRDEQPVSLVIEKRLGRLPLAIKLAASRAARDPSGVGIFAEEVEESGALQILNDPGESLAEELEKSLATLTPDQRVRFAALGLPNGPDQPRSLIESLLNAVPVHPVTPASGRNDLVYIVRCSLAEFLTPDSQATEAVQARVGVHPLLRELAQKKWTLESQETQAAGLTALLTGVRDLVRTSKDDFEALARDETVIAGAIRQGVSAHSDAEIVAEIINDFGNYLYFGGHWRLGLELLQMLADVQKASGDELGRAETLNNMGLLAIELKRPEQATLYLEEALEARRSLHDTAGEAETLANLGYHARTFGRPAEAREHFEQALRIAHENHDDASEAILLNNLGSLEQAEDRLDTAAALYEQAVSILERGGDDRSLGRMLGNLGEVRVAQSRFDDATHLYEQALAAVARGHDEIGQGRILQKMADQAVHRERFADALALYEQALAIFETKDDAHDLARAVRLQIASVSRSRPSESMSSKRLFGFPIPPRKQAAKSPVTSR